MTVQTPDVDFVFANEKTAPRDARRQIVAMFGGPPLDARADALQLAASELVSNVVLHTRRGGVLRAWRRCDHRNRCRLEVIDTDPHMPTIEPTPELTGRGLRILDDLAVEWGVQVGVGCKRVWAEFDC